MSKICPQCNTEYGDEQLFCPKDGSTLKGKGGAADLIGSIIQKVYHVKKKLGEGGMGTVYLAEHVKMGRKSALKVMNPGMVHDADAISRFNREAANASKINHPNVAAVYDFGETEDGLIFLAMEFIEGPSLTKVIEDAGSLPPARAAEITRQAAEALSVAHDMGIVHRDLKPDNIMLAKGREGVDVVKVVDFGIAKAGAEEGQKVTKTGMVVGTPEYMSPEQLSGDKLDGRSDTYSLALVAFNMLTGKLPFPGATSQETMIARLTDFPKTLAEMKPTTPWSPDVEAVMGKALARDASERYTTAAEFGRELARTVSMMPATDEVTAAHTAVMAPPAATAPQPAAKGAAKTAAEPARGVPPTRIGAATPAGSSAAPAPAPTPKSRMPLFAGIGTVVAIGAVVAYMKLGSGGTPPDDQFRQQNTGATGTAPAASPAATPTVTLSVSERFDEVEALTDITKNADSASAIKAIAKLDSLTGMVTSDEDKVHITIVRAEALMLVGQQPNGCRLIKDNEGKANRTKNAKLIGRTKILLGAC